MILFKSKIDKHYLLLLALTNGNLKQCFVVNISKVAVGSIHDLFQNSRKKNDSLAFLQFIVHYSESFSLTMS